MSETICNFNKTKTTLRNLGIVVEDVSGYKPIQGVDVGIRELRENISFESPSGIFYTESSGQRHRGFLYKPGYDLAQYPQGPKFHICRCNVIEDFINRGSLQSSYRFAETADVLVFDWATRQNVTMQIGMCNYCRNMLSFGDELRTIRTSADFAVLVEDSNRKQVEKFSGDSYVDVFGYTKDWHEISTKYKEKHNYTCENCGITITDPFDRQYIHVHHINGDKTFNDESNLKCLCIDCHSKVDGLHKENFSYGAKRITLREFLEKYKYNLDTPLKKY